jgi:ankyrin repeat protein
MQFLIKFAVELITDEDKGKANALIHAVQGGSASFVKPLIPFSAINHSVSLGNTALHYAAERGHN